MEDGTAAFFLRDVRRARLEGAAGLLGALHTGVGVGRKEPPELRPTPGIDLAIRGRDSHACFDARDTRSSGLDPPVDAHETERATRVTSDPLDVRRWNRSLEDLLPRLELARVERREGRVGAEARDVDPGGVGSLEDRGSIASLDLRPVYGQADHRWGRAHHECSSAPGAQAAMQGKGARSRSGLQGAQEYLIFLR